MTAVSEPTLPDAAVRGRRAGAASRADRTIGLRHREIFSTNQNPQGCTRRPE